MAEPSPTGWSRTTWILSALILLTAASTLLGVNRTRLPGTLRLGVMDSGGVVSADQGLRPLADYLGVEIRRSVVVERIAADELPHVGQDFDIALVPLHGELEADEVRLLAWAKPAGHSGWEGYPTVLHHRDRDWPPPPGSRLAFGDAHTWTGRIAGKTELLRLGWSPEMVEELPCGHDPYDHTPIIAALVFGGLDYVFVRESDVTAARNAGLLPRGKFVSTRVGPARGDFALIAGDGLSEGAWDQLEAAVLNLDHYRFDPSRLRASSAVHALGQLGLSGFAPPTVLPSLRR